MAALRPEPSSSAASPRRARGGDRPLLVTPDPTSGDGLEPIVIGDEAAAVEILRGGELAVRSNEDRRARARVGWIGRAGGAPLVEVELDGWRFVFRVEDADRAALRALATRSSSAAVGTATLAIRTPIPGRIVSVDVSVGDRVEAGGRLLTVEAMKMQNEVRAPRAGAVVRVDVAAGQAVEAGAALVLIE